MLLNSNILPIIIAGLMNASFIIPAKYIKNIISEKIWLYHSVIGFSIVPWLILASTNPNNFQNYLFLQPTVLLFLLGGGIIFGLGQVCFAYALEFIGVALSFTINLGIGVVIGSMFVVLYKNTPLNTHDYFVVLAVCLIICSLISYYYSNRNNNNKKDFNYKNSSYSYYNGWILASLAGFASGLQNITFIIIAFHTKTDFQINNSFWIWPPFLLAAAIPMLFGFGYRIKNKTKIILEDFKKFLDLKDIFLVTLMGLFFTGSLALYSNGMNKLTHEQQIIGWPIFMVSIIFTSQLWGQIFKESAGATKKYKLYKIFSIILLLVAIVILAKES